MTTDTTNRWTDQVNAIRAAMGVPAPSVGGALSRRERLDPNVTVSSAMPGDAEAEERRRLARVWAGIQLPL